jgi:Immunoglobulin I-set domain
VLQVQWYHDNFMLDPNDRRTMVTMGTKHTLSIRNVQSEDFGNYSCIADNSLGRARKYMELSGMCIFSSLLGGRTSPVAFETPKFQL